MTRAENKALVGSRGGSDYRVPKSTDSLSVDEKIKFWQMHHDIFEKLWVVEHLFVCPSIRHTASSTPEVLEK
jgi:hypothetical protein